MSQRMMCIGQYLRELHLSLYIGLSRNSKEDCRRETMETYSFLTIVTREIDRSWEHRESLQVRD